MFDIATLLKMFGLTPEIMQREFGPIKAKAEQVEASVSRIEAKLDNAIALMEAIHDALSSGDDFTFNGVHYIAELSNPETEETKQ